MKTLFTTFFLLVLLINAPAQNPVDQNKNKQKSGSSFIGTPNGSASPSEHSSRDQNPFFDSTSIKFRATGCVNIPKGEYGRASENIPIGFLLGLSFKPYVKVPFSFGFDAGYYWVALRDNNFSLNLPIEGSNSVVKNVDIDLKARFKSSITPILFHADIWLPYFDIMPYATVIGGGNFFTTTTRITEEGFIRILTKDAKNNEIRRQNNALTFAWVGGFGAGLRSDFDDFELDLGLNYLYGGNTSYYDGDNIADWRIEVEGDPAEFVDQNKSSDDNYVKINLKKKSSNTNMLQFMVRIAAKF